MVVPSRSSAEFLPEDAEIRETAFLHPVRVMTMAMVEASACPAFVVKELGDQQDR